jgi:hypothetical protein
MPGIGSSKRTLLCGICFSGSDKSPTKNICVRCKEEDDARISAAGNKGFQTPKIHIMERRESDMYNYVIEVWILSGRC